MMSLLPVFVVVSFILMCHLKANAIALAPDWAYAKLFAKNIRTQQITAFASGKTDRLCVFFYSCFTSPNSGLCFRSFPAPVHPFFLLSLFRNFCCNSYTRRLRVRQIDYILIYFNLCGAYARTFI